MFALLTYFSYILKGYKPGVCFGVFLGFFSCCVCVVCLFLVEAQLLLENRNVLMSL